MSESIIKKLKIGIKDVPFALLLIDFVSWLFSLWNVYLFDYWIVAEIASHSLLTVFFMGFYAYVHRFCLYSWVCIAGLALINILNLFHYFFEFQYYQTYIGIIVITSLTFALIKWKQYSYKL